MFKMPSFQARNVAFCNGLGLSGIPLGIPAALRAFRMAMMVPRAPQMGPDQGDKRLFTTNQTFAGLSANRRMYQGNHDFP
jgi:hypothetical protein